MKEWKRIQNHSRTGRRKRRSQVLSLAPESFEWGLTHSEQMQGLTRNILWLEWCIIRLSQCKRAPGKLVNNAVNYWRARERETLASSKVSKDEFFHFFSPSRISEKRKRGIKLGKGEARAISAERAELGCDREKKSANSSREKGIPFLFDLACWSHLEATVYHLIIFPFPLFPISPFRIFPKLPSRYQFSPRPFEPCNLTDSPPSEIRKSKIPIIEREREHRSLLGFFFPPLPFFKFWRTNWNLSDYKLSAPFHKW